MQRLFTLSVVCTLVLASCARIEIPSFTAVDCSADPVHAPIKDSARIKDLSNILHELPNKWAPAPKKDVKVGLAFVLKDGARAVAQIVIGENWISIQETDNLGRPKGPNLEQEISAGYRDRIISMVR